MIFCPDFFPARVAKALYRQHRDVNLFLNSDSSITRTNYLRILAVASIDIAITFPIGVAFLILNITQSVAQNELSFYPGWDYVHSEWEPPYTATYAELVEGGTSYLAGVYISNWSQPVLAFAIFGLFGLTAEARATYRRPLEWIRYLLWRPSQRKRNGASSDCILGPDTGCQKAMLDAELRFVASCPYALDIP